MWKLFFVFSCCFVLFWGMCFSGGQETGSWGPWPENFVNGCSKAWTYISEWATHTSNESIRGRVEDIYKCTDEERVKEGLSTLKRDSRLEAMAQEHAEYMHNKGGDCNHDGFGLRADQAFLMGFNTVSENVAWNSSASGKMFVSQWMNSYGHRGNILDRRVTNIGVGVYGGYAVQFFAGY